MKTNDKPNYFTRFLKKRQQQFHDLRNKKELLTQSTCLLNPNTLSKADKDHIKQKLIHQKTISTPIDSITPTTPTLTPSLNVHKASSDTKNNDAYNKHQSHKDLLSMKAITISNNYTSRLSNISNIMTYKNIETMEKKVHDLLNIIDVFERENNLNYEPFKTFFYEGDSNTERYIDANDNDNDNNNDNNSDVKDNYVSPPNSIRFNKTINNLSLSSKESTHYISKMISQQQMNNNNNKNNIDYNYNNNNNNNNEVISKTYLDESGNNTLCHYTKSYSMKRAKNNYPKLIGLKQNKLNQRTKDRIIKKDRTITNERSKEYTTRPKKVKTFSSCFNRTEENSYTNKFIKNQSKYKDKTETNIKDLSYNLVLVKGVCRNRSNNNNNNNDDSVNNNNKRNNSNSCNSNQNKYYNILNSSNSKPPKRSLLGINIRKFNNKDNEVSLSKSQCQSARNKNNNSNNNNNNSHTVFN